MKRLNLTQLVLNICSGNFCQSELIQYINLTQKISLSYLKYQEMLGKRISEERPESENELSDMALDCIAELFARDETGNFSQLKRYYEAKFSEMHEIADADVLILTRRLIVRKTKQELSRIFRERDPEGAKIVRNIKVAIRTSEKLYLFRDMGKEFVFYGNGMLINKGEIIFDENLNQYLRKQHPPISEDVLHQYFLDLYNPSDSVSVIIRKLLQRIYTLEYYQNYISLDAIVKMVRNVKFDAFRERMIAKEKVPTPADNLESKEIEGYIDLVMESMWTRLDSQYLKTEKLKKDKAVIYHKALREVLNDLIHKKDNSSYFRNLKYYLPELSQQAYRQQERSIFEYLAKLAKKEFRKYLAEMI